MFCSLVVSCSTCDHKVGGSIQCHGQGTLLIRSKIVLFPPLRLQLRKNSKSEAEFIMSNKLSCYVQINSVAKPNFE